MYRGEQHNLIIPSPTENLFQWNFCARRDELRAGGDTFSVHPHRLSSRFHNTKPCPKTSTRHDTKFVQHPAVLCYFPPAGPPIVLRSSPLQRESAQHLATAQNLLLSTIAKGRGGAGRRQTSIIMCVGRRPVGRCLAKTHT